MNLGDRLFELRKGKNLTQDDVAEKLNITRQTVSKWETNQSTPDFDKIVPLCELYEILPNELLMGEKNETDDEKDNNSSNWKEMKEHFFINKKRDEDNYENMTKDKVKYKSAEVVSGSIFIFFVAIIFIIIGNDILNLNSALVVCGFLLLVGIGVKRIVKHYMSIPKFEKTKKEEKQEKIIKQINHIIECIGIVIYFVLSFATMAWYITWIIFLIIPIVERIVKLMFILKEDDEIEE